MLRYRIPSDWKILRRGRTLFAVRGRAKLWFPLSIYVACSCVVVTIMMWYLPGVVAVKELDALQSALGLIGTSLFLLQAFRVNSSYGELTPVA